MFFSLTRGLFLKILRLFKPQNDSSRAGEGEGVAAVQPFYVGAGFPRLIVNRLASRWIECPASAASGARTFAPFRRKSNGIIKAVETSAGQFLQPEVSSDTPCFFVFARFFDQPGKGECVRGNRRFSLLWLPFRHFEPAVQSFMVALRAF